MKPIYHKFRNNVQPPRTIVFTFNLLLSAIQPKIAVNDFKHKLKAEQK